MTAARVAAPAAAAPVGGRDLAWWGLMCLIVAEGMLFAFLLASYFYVESTHGTWPPSGPPSLRIVGPNTALLVASSGAMWWADRASTRGQRGGLVAGLAVTFLMGATFLAFQMVEYQREEFRPQTDAYGSLFYTITGFHGAHVLAGLLFIAHTLLRALAGHFRGGGEHPAVRNTAYYWHFVDVVWLVVFTSLYLTPYLW